MAMYKLKFQKPSQHTHIVIKIFLNIKRKSCY